ncbi:hypothetical protein P4V86_14670 [Brevibacillus laterosporus]|uniref:hypothetical protein n=1 Tax=Brevibacillus laterosporus TaxID=1465 RepID=UPI000360D99A|nr:hypothetical protein [Brevibacillus laterosporus]ATO49332.1 hypothetical protein BrL25_09555 [Brevibacillus laterosporus DSM 25]MBG9800787.1 hypothetical protein [Brevibacillus laterosporus]MED2004594.1 hypothetical protein [Brevibacillus laterosporus]MED4762223.1 hypothetical protein [Brevibacillus laterosporus]TPH19476.1 hypothetical protein EGH09_06575 [Brevibacillus laterosporus]
MKTKTGVQFRKTIKTTHAFERLKYCPKCRSYSVLWDTECPFCEKTVTLLPIRAVSAATTRRNVQISFLWIGLFVCLGAIFADTTTNLILACSGGVLFFVLFWLMQKRYGSYEQNVHFEQFINTEQENIKNALYQHLEDIDADVKAKKYKDAYEKIREVGYFIDSDLVKILKVKYLNHFVLRKDMELELDTLIPSDYNHHFIAYLHEVLKVQPWLVKQAVLDYVISNKSYILQESNGTQILGQVAGASLRVRAHIEHYQDFIIEFIEYLPKERLIRLAKMVSAHQDGHWAKLYEATRKQVDQHYSFDPELKGLL